MPTKRLKSYHKKRTQENNPLVGWRANASVVKGIQHAKKIKKHSYFEHDDSIISASQSWGWEFKMYLNSIPISVPYSKCFSF